MDGLDGLFCRFLTCGARLVRWMTKKHILIVFIHLPSKRAAAAMADLASSVTSQESPHSEDTNNNSQNQGSNAREQDRFLPIANISRIMKKAVPANAKIAKDAKDTVQECVSEFISFITSEASDKCQREKRKTINGDDLLWAMGTLGFEDYVEPLKLYLHKYREAEGDSKGAATSRSGVGDPTKKDSSNFGALPNIR